MDEVKKFHGFVAPGLLIGGYMVDIARKKIGENVEADAIVESAHCLPDAVQILTPCTLGNGWLKVLNLGKFAITLFDRHTFKGCRVYLDLKKLEAHPNIYNWYMGLVSKKDLPKEILIGAILEAKKDILSSKDIIVRQHGERNKKSKVIVCGKCNEAYFASQGDLCLACQGKDYYEEITV
ncbi:MAG: formylmethanofuran dehydrogenase subunit E family protein [Proteobacteria bacterium]|nr:formylmethanofuran dehydrogenase subunit E family protein [Pseudomonadota bacterium]